MGDFLQFLVFSLMSITFIVEIILMNFHFKKSKKEMEIEIDERGRIHERPQQSYLDTRRSLMSL